MTQEPVRFEGIERLCFYERLEFRPPKKDEFYLSGAIVQAYKAPNDLGISFRVVRPTFKAEKKTIFVQGERITDRS